MNVLFHRELRRQTPVALAAIILGLLFAIVGAAFGVHGSVNDLTVTGFGIAAIAAPFLLGLATFAPDVETGAASFIATLPVSRRRELVARWGAALALSVVTLVAGLVILLASGVSRRDLGQIDFMVGAFVAVYAFSSAVLASIVARRTLVALVVALGLSLVPVQVIHSFGQRLDPPFQLDVTVGLLPPFLIICAAWVHLRGDAHTDWRRPALMTAGAVGGLLVAIMGFTTACWALDVPTAPWEVRDVRLSSSARTALVFELRRNAWHGDPSWRGELVDVETLARRELPAAIDGSFSPSGRTALVALQGDGDMRLVDVATGAATSAQRFRLQRRSDRAEDLQTSSIRLYVASAAPSRIAPVVWDGEEPVSVIPPRRWNGGRASMPEISSLEAASGSRVIERLGDRRFVREASGSRRPLELPPGFLVEDLRLSPSGDVLLAIGREGERQSLRAVALDHASRRHDAMLDLPPGAVSLLVSFSPDERRLVVRARPKKGKQRAEILTELDFVDGSVRPLEGWPHEELPLAWSASGRRVAFANRTWRDREGQTGGWGQTPGWFVGFKGEEEALVVVDTGTIPQLQAFPPRH